MAKKGSKQVAREMLAKLKAEAPRFVTQTRLSPAQVSRIHALGVFKGAK